MSTPISPLYHSMPGDPRSGFMIAQLYHSYYIKIDPGEGTSADFAKRLANKTTPGNIHVENEVPTTPFRKVDSAISIPHFSTRPNPWSPPLSVQRKHAETSSMHGNHFSSMVPVDMTGSIDALTCQAQALYALIQALSAQALALTQQAEAMKYFASLQNNSQPITAGHSSKAEFGDDLLQPPNQFGPQDANEDAKVAEHKPFNKTTLGARPILEPPKTHGPQDSNQTIAAIASPTPASNPSTSQTSTSTAAATTPPPPPPLQPPSQFGPQDPIQIIELANNSIAVLNPPNLLGPQDPTQTIQQLMSKVRELELDGNGDGDGDGDILLPPSQVGPQDPDQTGP